MKLSALFLSGIVLASSGMVKGEESCADTIGFAQQCIKKCVDSPPVVEQDAFGVYYGNRLFECLDQDVPSRRSVQLQGCCGMNTYEGVACDQSLVEAESCLNSTLVGVFDATLEYLTCLDEKTISGECPWGNFCLAILTGGFGANEENDFGVGSGSALANITDTALTCTDLDVIGYNACNEVANCCTPCADRMAAIASAVITDILVPNANNSQLDLASCDVGDKTCTSYLSTGGTNSTGARKLDIEDEMLVSPATIVSDGSVDVAELAGECTDGLMDEIVVYNETYAVTHFFECIYKKTGKVFAANEQATPASGQSSSIATSLTTLSAIASAVYAMVVF